MEELQDKPRQFQLTECLARRQPSAWDDIAAASTRMTEYFKSVMAAVTREWPYYNRSRGYDHLLVLAGAMGNVPLDGAWAEGFGGLG